MFRFAILKQTSSICAFFFNNISIDQPHKCHYIDVTVASFRRGFLLQLTHLLNAIP
jgi:hypothetical protein